MPAQVGTGYTVPIKIDPTQAVAGARAANTSLNKLGASALSATRIVRALAVSMAGLTGGVALALAIRQIAIFEDSMAKVRAVTQAAGKDFQDLERITRRLGATTVFTATQAAEAALFLARAGFTTSEIQKSLTSVLHLARAGGIELESAANITANTLRGFALDASQAARVANALAIASSRANTTIQQLGEGIKFVAPVANAFGVTFEETTTVLAKLSDAGLKASISGTGLRRILSGLANLSGPTRKLLTQLGVDIGKLDVRTNGVLNVIEELKRAGVGGSEAFQLFGQRGGPGFLVLRGVIDEARELNEELLTMRGRAQEMARVMDDTLLASFKALISAISETTIEIGDGGFGGGVRSTTDTITGLISVWNGMTVEFARGRDYTDDQTQSLVDLASTVKSVTNTILTLVGVPLVIWLTRVIYNMHLLRAVLNVVKIHPVITAITLFGGAFAFFTSKFDSDAERFEKNAANVESSLARIREAAGRRNFEAGTLGNIFDPIDVALEKANLTRGIETSTDERDALTSGLSERLNRDIQRYQTNFGAQAQIPNSPLAPEQSVATAERLLGVRKEILENQKELQSIVQQAASSERKFTNDEKQSVVRLAEAIKEGVRQVNVGAALASGLDAPAAREAAEKTAQNHANIYLETIKKIFSANKDIEDQSKALVGFDFGASADVEKPGQLGEFEKIIQLYTQGRSIEAQDIAEQDRLRALQEAGPVGVARLRSELDTARDFGRFGVSDEGDPLSDGLNQGQLDNLQKVIDLRGIQGRQYAEQIQDDKERVKFLELLAGEQEGYNKQLEGLPAVYEKVRNTRFEIYKREELAEAEKNYKELVSSIDGVRAAEIRLEESREIIRDSAAFSTEDERAAALNAVEEAAKKHLDPLGAAVDDAREQLELTMLHGDELIRKQALLEVEAILENNVLSLSQEKLEAARLNKEEIAEQIALLRIQSQLEGAKQSLRQEFPGLLQDEDAGPSARSKASTELFGETRNEIETANIDESALAIDDVIQAQERFRAGFQDASWVEEFRDTFVSNMDLLSQHTTTVAGTISQAFAGAFSQVGNAVAQIVVYGKSSEDVFRALGQQILASIISTLVQIGVQMLVMAVLGKSLQAANVAAAVAALGSTTAASVAAAGATASAWAPAALATSLASFGANSAPAIAGITAAAAAITTAQASTAATGAGGAAAGGLAVADGGYISGPGGPRSDSIPARLSDGEFVINAAATKRNRGLLEAINNSSRYADGGIVGAGGGAGGGMNLNVTVENETGTPVEIESRHDAFTGRVVLTMKEALDSGLFDDNLEQFGAQRQPEA